MKNKNKIIGAIVAIIVIAVGYVILNGKGTLFTGKLITSKISSACLGPYHGQTKDGRCVWSCGLGTQPDNPSDQFGQCVCREGYQDTGDADQFGRRICELGSATPVPEPLPSEQQRTDQECQSGVCVSLCGNRVVDAGENCASCSADVVCAEGTVCKTGVCMDSNPPPPNGITSSGEGCYDCLPPPLWRQERVISNLNYVQQILISPSNENSLITLAGYTSSETQSVYISDDGGTRWRKTLGGNKEGIQIIVASSNDVNTIYAGTYIRGVEVTGKLYISSDFGQSWDELAEFRDGAIRNIHIDRSNPLRISVFTQPSSSAYEAGVHISNDGGITWEFHSFGFPSSYLGTIVWAVEQNLEGDLFLGIELDRTVLDSQALPYKPPILRSRDGGITWENIFPENPWHISDIEIDDLNNNIYFKQEGPAIYILRDNENALSELNSLYGFQMTLNKNNPREIFFGTWSGLWLTIDGAETLVRVTDTGNVAGMAYTGDYMKLYVATYGQGIQVFERIE